MQLEYIGQKSAGGDAVSFLFSPQEPLLWTAGQYMDFELPHPDPDQRGTHRWFTIASAPAEKNVMITTRLMHGRSSFKTALSRLKPGSKVISGAPRGDFVLEDNSPPCLFIAGGIGITPFRSMLTQLAYEGRDLAVDLLYLNKDEELVHGGELSALARKLKNFRLRPYIGRRVTRHELEAFADKQRLFYISGPRAMVESYQQMLEEMVPPEQVKTDYFPGY